MGKSQWKITLKRDVGGSKGWKKGETAIIESPPNTSGSSIPSPTWIQKCLNEQLSGEAKNVSVSHQMWDVEKI